MKYMGSKRTMLLSGFGQAIIDAAVGRERVVDLFAGSAAVVWYAAEKTALGVLAVDLQTYSVTLANAVLLRTEPADAGVLEQRWLRETEVASRRSRLWARTEDYQGAISARKVRLARQLCRLSGQQHAFWSAYGGHYYSPRQALLFSNALRYLPDEEPFRSICKAATIAAASYCAAAPGHTAQPFQPTANALPYLQAAWQREPLDSMRWWLRHITSRHAQRLGEARVGEAVDEAAQLRESDVVIVDPPYSAVQYSRFYHVLESIAREEVEPVVGTGRYPPPTARPRSLFSLKGQAQTALVDLLDALSDVGCTVLITFPAGQCSNGLSGAMVQQLAADRFLVAARTVLGRFSTLGGNNLGRAARRSSAELILALTPR